MSEIKRFLTGPLPTNTYMIKKDNDNVILIDPGPGAEGLFDILLERGERIRAILITHGHSDHVDGVAGIKKRALEQNGESIKCYAPKADEKTFSDSDWNSSLMIVGEKKNYEKDVDMWLSDGQEIDFDGLLVRTIVTPGHTIGGASFYFPGEIALFSGDTLFSGSVGRTDFPGGSMSELIRSVHERLFTLPDTTRVYPGHNEETTIEREKRENPFFSGWLS